MMYVKNEEAGLDGPNCNPNASTKDLFKIIKRINENNEPVVIKPTKADERALSSLVKMTESNPRTLFLVNHVLTSN